MTLKYAVRSGEHKIVGLGAWSAPRGDKFEGVGDYRAQVIRATLCIDSDQAGELLSRLGKGDDIKETSCALDLELSESIEKRIGAFSLSGGYVYRPVALLLNRDAHERVGPQSPHGNGRLKSTVHGHPCNRLPRLHNAVRGPLYVVVDRKPSA